jgi:quercetin 2,3-dioxygenase
MKSIFHAANTRGHANHGWLNAHHSFSFASWQNPARVHFGALRVLNDDIIAGGRGFGTHPHDNMEIVTIPLDGDLEHKDSMGNIGVIQQGDVQAMSAGSGVSHSEYNKNADKSCSLLQIWVFPKLKNIVPRYDQKTFLPEGRVNKLQTLVEPDGENGASEAMKINQDAWFSLGKFDAGAGFDYSIKKAGNGVYAFLIAGEAEIGGQKLQKRDALGIWETGDFSVIFSENSEILLLDVPMVF